MSPQASHEKEINLWLRESSSWREPIDPRVNVPAHNQFLDLEVLGIISSLIQTENRSYTKDIKVVLYYSWLVKEFYYLPAHERGRRVHVSSGGSKEKEMLSAGSKNRSSFESLSAVSCYPLVMEIGEGNETMSKGSNFRIDCPWNPEEDFFELFSISY